MARRVYKYCRYLLKIKNKPRQDEEGKILNGSSVE